MVKGGLQVDSHNSLLTNRETAILSAKINGLADVAHQTLRFDDIASYFYNAEHYYLTLNTLISKETIKKIESLRKSYYKLENLIDSNVSCRNRKALRLLLGITKEFYFSVRNGLQESKYYFRVSELGEKGLGNISFFDSKDELVAHTDGIVNENKFTAPAGGSDDGNKR